MRQKGHILDYESIAKLMTVLQFRYIEACLAADMGALCLKMTHRAEAASSSIARENRMLFSR